MLGAFGEHRQTSQPAELPPVYVQSPFAGEYPLAQMTQVAEGRVWAYSDRLSADHCPFCRMGALLPRP